MAKKIKAIIGCKLSHTNKVISLGEEVQQGISTSASYPSPNPAIGVLSAALALAKGAKTKWGDRKVHGSSADKANFKAAMASLFDILVQLCAYVNNTTPGDVAALSTSGFPLSSQPQKQPLMEPPGNLRRMLDRNLGLHQAKVKCTKPANAAKYQRINYLYYRSFTPDFASAQFIVSKTKTSHIDIPAMPGNVAGNVYYWVTALTSAGQSDPSGVCQVAIMPL